MQWLFGIAGMAALLMSGVAQASDYCITFPSAPNFELVGRGFTIPGKGTCGAWIGFTPEGSFNSPSAGTGCTSSNGSHLSLTITTSAPEHNGNIIIDSITLSLPGATGTDNEAQIVVGVTGSIPAAAADSGKCKSVIKIPAAISGFEGTSGLGLAP